MVYGLKKTHYMFTGIIQDIGFLKGKKKNRDGTISLEISSTKLPSLPSIRPGESVAVNGVCLTVTKKTTKSFFVDVVRETLVHTNLGKIRFHDSINLEPSLRASDAISGHFVTGHVDAEGRVTKKTASELSLEFPKKLARFFVEKGSVALNGVSLTITKIHRNTLSVAIIPFTEKNTNLGALRRSDPVNIEIDIFIRYLANLTKNPL